MQLSALKKRIEKYTLYLAYARWVWLQPGTQYSEPEEEYRHKPKRYC